MKDFATQANVNNPDLSTFGTTVRVLTGKYKSRLSKKAARSPKTPNCYILQHYCFINFVITVCLPDWSKPARK